MAASTHAVGKATASFQPTSETFGGNTVCVTAEYSLAANASANDVYQMIKIPSGATIIDGHVKMTGDLGFAISVGDGGDAARFVAAYTCSATVTTGTTKPFLQTVLPYTYSLTANANPQYDTIDVKATVIAATVAMKFTLTVWYILP